MPSFDLRRDEERAEHEAEHAAQPPASVHAPIERLAAGMGNQAFSALARQGAGIMPDGRAHPDVEAAIAQTRGGGGQLDTGARERFGPDLGDSLSDVRVHTDANADALTRSVSARAFTTGSDVYFASGEYRPGTEEGDALLAHELTHVVQQRGTPETGPMVVSQPGDSLESEADQAVDELLG